jgi:hypothetical protein
VGNRRQPAFLSHWQVGSFPEALQDPDGVSGPFGAVVTCFSLDVLPDIVGALRELHAVLEHAAGVWVNLGPLAFPHAFEELGGPRAFPLSHRQLRGLILDAGFVFEDEKTFPCEYSHPPRWLERTMRTCMFFVARPAPARVHPHPL